MNKIPSSTTNNKKVYLSTFSLVCLCIGPMVGAGLFALPQNVAQGGGVIATFISMLITCIGMYCLSRAFQYLAARLKQSEASLYTYAKNCGGNYLGFCSAWGYWIAGWTGNVAYLLMLCSTLNYFFPFFSGLSSNTLIFSSIILWTAIGIYSLGLKFSSNLNIFSTILKLIPIAFFLFICCTNFSGVTFITNWQEISPVPLFIQIKKIMLVTAWIFIGIEGASVFNTQAKNVRMVGYATILSFLTMFLVYLAIAILPFGIDTRANLATLSYPPVGTLAQQLIGNFGSVIMHVGLILAVLGAFFSWLILIPHVPFMASKIDNLFPETFKITNRRNIPIGALIITGLCEEIYLILAYYLNFDYLGTITIAVTMTIPAYLLSAIEYLHLVWKRRLTIHFLSKKNIFFSVVSILYSCWILYSAEQYFLYSSILFSIGSLIYLWHGYNQNKEFSLNQKEIVLFTLTTFFAIISIYLIFFGN